MHPFRSSLGKTIFAENRRKLQIGVRRLRSVTLCTALTRVQDRRDQTTPWGGGKKRGEENLTNDTPPKKGFWTPLVRYVFHPPQVSVLCFSCTKTTTEQNRSSFGGVQNFSGRACSLVRFPPPHTFCTPPYHGPKRDGGELVGNGPNTVSGSTVSNTELSEFCWGLTEFRGASSVISFWPIICVPKRTHRVFRRTHRVCPKTQ